MTRPGRCRTLRKWKEPNEIIENETYVREYGAGAEAFLGQHKYMS
jgi:hypothetical protein